MKCGLFENVKSKKGIECTLEKWLEYSSSERVKSIIDRISQLPPEDHDAIGKLKKELPVVTWQAYFEGRRLNSEARASGLCIIDIDDVDNPYQLWCSIIGRREELGILLAHKTPSGHGLRLVFLCRKEFTTLDECQQWMAREIGVKHDEACKDWARASYMVPDNYIYFYDGKLFSMEPEVVYEVKTEESRKPKDTPRRETEAETEDEHLGLAGESKNLTFKGIPLKDIAIEWLKETGGEPVEGERNMRLHALAYELRYITDFNEQIMLEVMPSYGLPGSEMQTLIHSACTASRSNVIPQKLHKVLDKLLISDVNTDDDIYINSKLSIVSSQLPPLPPLVRQLVRIAPQDFVIPTILCMLPLLGALGSKLRARYLDNDLHSPSFQVSLEAPQASGKSFIARMAQMILAPIIERDNAERQREQEYNERVAELKVTGVKVTPENREELLGQRPKGIIRYVPATISVTKMLMRMQNACGLHLVAVCEEIDTVTKAFKRAISSYSDALMVSFSNGPYGQDYASENSFSGIVPLYYNTLFSGTPKAMCRFYPDVEDGLVSRVLFVSLPDQFGKPMPVWGELTEKEREEVEMQINRLDEVSIVGDVVQHDHEMDMGFLNRAMNQWLKEQQEEAIRMGNRTQDVFCRRDAVVGFRAGMLAWFLYGEKNTATIRHNTVAFAKWVASQMLMQHLLRFQIDGTGSNISHWEEVYNRLNDEFTREELQRTLTIVGKTTPIKNVIYNWRLLDIIEITETETAINGKQQAMKSRRKERFEEARHL